MTTEIIIDPVTDDDFAAAFATLTNPPAEPVAEEKPAEKKFDDVSEPAVAEVVADESEAKAEVSTPVLPTTKVETDTAAELAELRARLAQLEAPAEEPKPEPTKTPVYTDEENTIVESYKKEWPDVIKGEALLRRAEYQQLVNYVFEEVRKHTAPLQEFFESQHGRTQYSDIVKLVPDYDDIRDKTLAWVDTQPAYLKDAYQRVANSGSPADVADLIARYKKDTGYVAPVAAVATTGGATAANKALPPAVKQAAAALKVVKSSRTEPSGAADPNDFDSAFEEFAKAK